MGQSPSTVSRRMHQALGELRSHLRLKGVFAMPAALAGLLCHATARQAPASLVHELGKMAMLTGAKAPARGPQPGWGNLRNNGAAPKISLMQAASPLILAFAAMAGMLLLLWMAGAWFSSRPPVDPDTLPHLKARPTAMLVTGTGNLQQVSLYISGQEAPSQ